jgi:hypothetical protein
MKKRYLFAALLFFQAFTTGAQIDTVPPTLVCKNSFGDFIFCFSNIYGHAFLDTVYDNSNGPVDIRLRRECVGTGFPENDNLVFGPGSINFLEIWARDAAGNTASCPCLFMALDQGFCDPAFSFRAITETNKPLVNTKFDASAFYCRGDTFTLSGISDDMGYYGIFGQSFPPDFAYEGIITASKQDSALNGVTTLDLLQIQKHVLGIEPLGSPYKIMAADANLSGSVTTADIVLLRKLLLGIITELPHGKTWRFIPLDYVFPNPNNPFETNVPEKIYIPASDEWFEGNLVFKAIKIGDVNNSAIPNN